MLNRITIIIFFGLFLLSCNSNGTRHSLELENSKQIDYCNLLNTIKVIYLEDYSIDINDFQESISILEDKTGIKSEVTDMMISFKVPTRKTFDEWLKWFNDHKIHCVIDIG